jgi:hypothetical protein
MKTYKTTILVALLVLLVAASAGFSQDSDGTNGTVLFGQSYSFVLKEPAGWVIDGKTKPQEVEAVFYRKGSSWKDAVAVMYARVIYKDKSRDTVEKVINNDVADFLKLSKESKVSDSPSLQTRFQKEGITKEFYDGANKNYELVTFIDEPKVVVIVALSSRDKSEYEKALPDFKSLVASYFVFTPLLSK